MTNPTIIGNATGSWMPNPAYYGFEWPALQAVLEALERSIEKARRRRKLG